MSHKCFECFYCKNSCPICRSCRCEGLGFAKFSKQADEFATVNEVEALRLNYVRELLSAMKILPAAYALTKEGFVATVSSFLLLSGCDSTKFFCEALSKNGENNVKIETCREAVTEEFAEMVVDKALKLLE